MAYNVLIVDDENMHRQLFSMIVERAEDFTLAGELAIASLAPSFVEMHPVDLVIMDIVMKEGEDGLKAAEEIKKIKPSIRILIVTSMPEAGFLKQARLVGVDSFWYKEVEDEPLLNVMRRTMKGESVYPDRALSVPLGLASSTDLTERELDVLRELLNGCSNQEISERLNMSVNTVRFHLSTLLSKTGCTSRTDLAIRAAKSGIIVIRD